jgi:hypothetical protein
VFLDAMLCTEKKNFNGSTPPTDRFFPENDAFFRHGPERKKMHLRTFIYIFRLTKPCCKSK